MKNNFKMKTRISTVCLCLLLSASMLLCSSCSLQKLYSFITDVTDEDYQGDTLFGSSSDGNSGGKSGSKSEGQSEGGASNQNYLTDPDSVITKREDFESPYGSAGENVFTISEVVRKVQDAVVVINATVVTSTYYGQQTSVSAGSGVVISENGYILTCNHVVEGASTVQVTVVDKTYSATLVGADSDSDLAVLKINATGLTYAAQGCSDALVVGEQVIAIGNPLGTLGGTVTSGIISAKERNILMEDGNYMSLLQTDAAINSGNSGGGLFNLRGELVGVVNAGYSSSGVDGIAFAIPMDRAYEVEKDLIQYGYVRGVMDDGLSLFDVTNSNLRNAYYYYGITQIGVYVSKSQYCSDLKAKDRIISVDGTTVSTVDEVDAVISTHKIGDTVVIVASRNGTQFTTSLTLREYVPEGIGN